MEVILAFKEALYIEVMAGYANLFVTLPANLEMSLLSGQFKHYFY
jgi:hypothetical protein